MKPLLALLPIALLAGCTGNPVRDCGLYDFDCDNTPSGDALFSPGQKTAAPMAGETPPIQADPVQPEDLAARVRLLEEEIRRLRRRIEVLEQHP